MTVKNLTDNRALVRRLNTYYHIIDKDKKDIPFYTNRAQEDFVMRMGKRNIILKSRQMGFSTLAAIMGLDHTLTSANANSLIIANNTTLSKDILRNKVLYAYNSMPDNTKKDCKMLADNQNQLVFNMKGFTNRITVRVSPRGVTPDFAHVTELSDLDRTNPQKAEELMQAMLGAMTTNGVLTVESTARCSTGEFYNLWHNSSFNKFFYNWQWDDWELDRITDDEIDYYVDNATDKMIKYAETHDLSDREGCYYFTRLEMFGGSWAKMYQEFPTTAEEAFLGFKGAFFDNDKISDQKIIEPIEESVRERLYEQFVAGNRYILAADVSEGLGRDDSTIVVIRCSNLTGSSHVTENGTDPAVVYVFKDNKIPPDNFAEKVNSISNKFGRCLCVIERNNIGHRVIGKLKSIDSSKLYIAKDGRAGFLTTRISKPDMLHDMRHAIYEEQLNLNDEWLMDELKSYSIDESKKSEHTGHFDLMMAAVIAWKTRDKSYPVDNDPYRHGYYV